MEYIWIGLGSAMGGVARHWLSGVVASRYGAAFPWGTLLVNTTGSFLIGFLAALSAPEGGRLLLPLTGRQFLMIGILGGYTTFSSFSLQTLELAREGEWIASGGNMFLSVAGCLVAVWAGHVLGQALNR